MIDADPVEVASKSTEHDPATSEQSGDPKLPSLDGLTPKVTVPSGTSGVPALMSVTVAVQSVSEYSGKVDGVQVVVVDELLTMESTVVDPELGAWFTSPEYDTVTEIVPSLPGDGAKVVEHWLSDLFPETTVRLQLGSPKEPAVVGLCVKETVPVGGRTVSALIDVAVQVVCSFTGTEVGVQTTPVVVEIGVFPHPGRVEVAQ